MFTTSFFKLKKGYKDFSNYMIGLQNWIDFLNSFENDYILRIFIDENIYNDNKWDIGDNFLSIKHFSNKFHILNTLILFYILPFVYFIKDVFLRKYNSKEYTIIALSILLFFFLTYFFNYSDTYNLTKSGGGFFYNLSQRLLENNYLFFICSLLGFLIIITISFVDVKNFGLFIFITY